MNENHNQNDFSDERLVKLLSAGAGPPAAPDEAFLSQLREESTKTFLESRPTVFLSPRQSNPMTFLRSLIGLALAAAALLLGYIALSNRPEPYLFEAVDKLAAKSSYRVRLVVGGRESEAVGKPELGIRFAEVGDRYSLSDGETAFQVDPAENLANPVPPTTSDEMLACHLLAGFLKSKSAQDLYKAAEAKEETDDKAELVYFCNTQVGSETIDMQWIVDAATRLPRSVEFLRDVNGRSTPFATLFVLAVNEPVDDETIKVSDSLTEDGRIGKVAVVQGFVSLRPKAITRWTPVCAPGGILKPGDWVRTDVRGANAVMVQLAPETKLTLGPGSLVELLRPNQIKVLSGEFEVFADVKHAVEVTAPDGTKITVMGPEIFRVQGEKLIKLAKEPLWLAGFKGTTPQETMGSLIAKVDGRNVPLHVGYHKVSVEIRDQIARTTIEESFVNNTNAVLEGQFHFPLPADASISGFGMWVGDRLVEADIVEKQRAREIYETILREKRDPGLLEWAGGNIFKARVYPIPARSEKRIKIVYTQVLPRVGNSYRYSYALQSDLLRQHPVRELNLTVTVSSAVKLAAISCPTHPARLQNAGHSARAEFSAQEYSPTKDFEVVVQVEDDKQGVVMIPHRRGDDGYFLLLLSPPTENGLWQRDVVPDGEPLKLIVLADTSASMDKKSRQTQDEVLGALLSSLGPKDSFQLAACDVDCIWTSDQPQVAEAKSIEAARSFLSKRRSMGWTDLDKAFAEALKKCDGKTQVVYLGDGVATTGDADGVAFAKRLVKMAEGKNPHPGPLPKGEGVTFHSIAVSSSFEAPVMKAIGSVGGGSVRNVSGEKGPQQTAKDLLAEIARPSLKNVNVKFNGLRTARVYPGTLTNLPLGTQQIILGRYLPEGKDQQGEVVVTGTLAGKEVTYRTAVALKDAEQGNSFIPRLWARMHLDELLAQGTSQDIQDEIINLSEEYHLMTPYTSLLVLESDADRERFKVKRRFQMRDGERFFADAKDKAQYELVQQQMRIAGNWRRQLRAKVLAELARLGRDPQLFEQNRELLMQAKQEQLRNVVMLSDGFNGKSSGSRYWGFGSSGGMGGMGMDDGMDYGMGGGMGGANFLGEFDEPMLGLETGFGRPALLNGEWDEEFSGAIIDRREVRTGERRLKASNLFSTTSGDTDDILFLKPRGLDAVELNIGVPYARSPSDDSGSWDNIGGPGLVAEYSTNLSLVIRQSQDTNGAAFFGSRSRGTHFSSGFYDYESQNAYDPFGGTSEYAGLIAERHSQPRLFPLSLPNRPRADKPPAELLGKHTAEVRDLVLSLLREEPVRALPGGVEIRRETESFEPRFAELTGKSATSDIMSGTLGWQRTQVTEGEYEQVDWCDGKVRGVWSPAFELALVRKAGKDEHGRWMGSLEDYPLLNEVAQFEPEAFTVEHPAENQVLLLLNYGLDDNEQPVYQTRFLIDTKRKILLAVENRYNGKTTQAIKFADFVEVAGRFWPQSQETLDEEGRRVSLTRIAVKTLSADEVVQEMKVDQAAREPSLTLHLPLPTLAHAKKSLVLDGELTPEVCLTLILHAAAKQDWEQVHERLAGIAELSKQKTWLRWLKLDLLAISRRHEELKGELMKLAGELAAKPHPGEWTLVKKLRQHGDAYLGTQENLDLLASLQPLFDRAPQFLHRTKEFDRARLQLLNSAQRVFEADALRKDLAEQYPRDLHLQTQYATWLAERDDYEGAYAWLKMTLGNAAAKWRPYERQQLQETYLRWLDEQGRHADKLEYLAPILAQNLDAEQFYSQQLVSLIYLGREAEAEKLMKDWLAAKLDEKNEPAIARANVAIQVAMNASHPFGSQQYDVAWYKPLSEFVLRNAVQTNSRINYAVQNILQNGQFSSSDAAEPVAKALAARLLAEANKLSPSQLEVLVEHVRNSRNDMEAAEWLKVAAVVQARWEKETKRSRRESLDDVLRNIHQETNAAARIAYLRLRVKRADDASRADKQRQLFDELIAQPWSAETESETLAMLPKLGHRENASLQLLDQLSHLCRWTDRMRAARIERLEGQIEKREQMTRQDLAEKRKKNTELVRTDLAKRLAAAAKDHKAELGRWLHLESLYISVEQEIGLPKVTETCWQLLEQSFSAEKEQDKERRENGELDVEQEEAQRIRDTLRLAEQARLVTMLVHLATQPSAKSQDADRLFKLCDERIVLVAKNRDDEVIPPTLDWQQVKYNLLVALDQPKVLAQQLAKWAAADTADHRWQRSLAYLNAELGKLDDAIKQFEGLESSGELSAADYRALATWYQATKQDAKNAQAKISIYKAMNEQSLQQMLDNRSGDASEVTPDDLLAYQAFFAKASNPSSGLGAVAKHYRSTQDFRLLAGLTDAVIGHSSEQIYPFLGQVESVLSEIHHEAAVDELTQRIGEVRKNTKSPVDLRALDLIELLVERRGAQLQNQAGPHLAAAVAALMRAEKREWSPGEPLQFAQLLTNISFIEQPTLAAEQIRITGALHAAAKPGSLDRLHLADLMATIHWRHDRKEEAIDLLSAACDEFREAQQGKSTEELRPVLFGLIRKLQLRGQFVRAEGMLLAGEAHAASPQEGHQLRLRLYDLYVTALREQGDTSLGKDQALYAACHEQLLSLLEGSRDQRERQQFHQRLCDLFVAAHAKKISATDKDLAEFVAKVFPEVARGQINNYRHMVSTTGGTIRTVLGPREALAFYIERIEHEPYWLARQGDDGWNDYHNSLAELRQEVPKLGPLEPRLLAIVIGELKRDLRTHNPRTRAMYSEDYGQFWKEKTANFAKAAEEVLAENKEGSESVQYIAGYFLNGLNLEDRGIEILLDAERRELLNDGGRQMLITALFANERHGEAVALLEALVRKQPKNFGWRPQLMHAYFKSKQPQALRRMLAQTHKLFVDILPNDEATLAAMGASTLENELYEQAASYYERAIKVRSDALQTRTQGDGTLAGYFQQQAKAYAGLGNTSLAVDKASAAIVIWPARHEQRQEAIGLLLSLLHQSPNLDAYVAELDKEVEKSQEDRPIVRKQIGIAYQDQHQAWDKAIKQFRLAIDLAPDDAELHERLIACLDAKQDKLGALTQTLESLELNRRNLELWQNLAERYITLEQPKQAERAATSLVEVAPHEAEGHQILAKYRESQNRWNDAIFQWREVARLRNLEPTGLLGLAPALLHERQMEEFDATLKQLESGTWSQHFQEELKEELPKLQKYRLKADK